MASEHFYAVIKLPKGKKTLVQLGTICLVVSVACYSLALSTLITPILREFDAIESVGLFSIVSSIGITIMTPIGGKLGDMFGRKSIVLIAGLICAVCGIGIAFTSNLAILLLFRLGVSIAQGAFMATPYIIVGIINDKSDVPRAMGYLTMALAIGGFGGSLIAGALTDLGMLKAAIIFPAVPLLLGIFLIAAFYPNDKSAQKHTIDTGGILLLVAALCSILLPLNYGPTIGWSDPLVLGGLTVGVLFIWLLIRYEVRQQQPIIPVYLFRRRDYLAFVLMSFLCCFYRGAMDVYSPLGALNILGVNNATAGALQLPRTIITMILPAVAGTWVGKCRTNLWKAMAIAMALAGLPMLVMGFTTTTTPVLMYFAALAVTGIAESYRGVSITPAAQSCLKPEEIGVGTALMNFFHSLSASLAAAIYGVIYGTFTATDATSAVNIQNGINAVFLTAGLVMLSGLVLVLLWIRPMLQRQSKENNRKKAVLEWRPNKIV